MGVGDELLNRFRSLLNLLETIRWISNRYPLQQISSQVVIVVVAVAEPWPTVVVAVGRGRRRTVADVAVGRGRR